MRKMDTQAVLLLQSRAKQRATDARVSPPWQTTPGRQPGDTLVTKGAQGRGRHPGRTGPAPPLPIALQLQRQTQPPVRGLLATAVGRAAGASASGRGRGHTPPPTLRSTPAASVPRDGRRSPPPEEGEQPAIDVPGGHWPTTSTAAAAAVAAGVAVAVVQDGAGGGHCSGEWRARGGGVSAGGSPPVVATAPSPLIHRVGAGRLRSWPVPPSPSSPTSACPDSGWLLLRWGRHVHDPRVEARAQRCRQRRRGAA